jgi:hypothetical protein
MPEGSEKRTFARVETNIRAYVRRLETGERMPEPFDTSNIASEARTPDLENSGLHEDVVRFLKALDAKLDMLVGYITQNRLKQEYRETVHVVELSGSGMRFISKSDFDPKQPIEVVIVLSRYPLKVASAAGRISRADEEDDKSWVMEFSHIRESDLERIVQFVFSEERERIREKKWGD